MKGYCIFCFDCERPCKSSLHPVEAELFAVDAGWEVERTQGGPDFRCPRCAGRSRWRRFWDAVKRFLGPKRMPYSKALAMQEAAMRAR